jgi:hypothetical protein
MWELSEEHRSSKGNSSLASNVMLCDSLFFQIGKGISHFWHRIILGAVDPKCNRAMNRPSILQLFRYLLMLWPCGCVRSCTWPRSDGGSIFCAERADSRLGSIADRCDTSRDSCSVKCVLSSV